MAQIGDVLGGKYRLVGLLGEGGMGAVYEAEHLEIGKRVAVKLLHPEVARNAEVVVRFTREARAAAAIGHLSIIDIYDIGRAEDGSLFLVMESLDGESLAELLGRRRSLDVPLAAYVTCQVLSALAAAHAKGIVHRDLKPDNVFLVRTGQALPGVKLLDFGISKMADPAKPEERLTKTGMVMGTPYYMAPEQAEGRSDLDERVDVYAVGVMLYEVLTARVPFTADNTLALIRKILNDPVTPPREIRGDLPPSLEAIVLKAMARRREDRHPSATALLRALFPFVEEHAAATIPLPPGMEGRVDGDASASEGALAATSRAVPTTAAESFGTAMAWEEGKSRRGGPGARGRRAARIAIAALVLAVALVAGAVMWTRAHEDRGSGGATLAPVATGDEEAPERQTPTEAPSPAGDGGADDAAPSAEGAADASRDDDGGEAADARPARVEAPRRAGREERATRPRDVEPEEAPPAPEPVAEPPREAPPTTIVITHEPALEPAEEAPPPPAEASPPPRPGPLQVEEDFH